MTFNTSMRKNTSGRKNMHVGGNMSASEKTLNAANLQVVLGKTKSQMDSLVKRYKERQKLEADENNKLIIDQPGAKSIYFTRKAVQELLREEGLVVKNTVVICLANQKGGVGKTMKSICLASNLSLLGFKTLLFDTDHQSNSTKSLIGRKGEYSLYDLLKGNKTSDQILEKVTDNLYLIPSNQNSSQVDLIMSDPKFTYNPSRFVQKVLFEVIDDMDFVIIDTNPSFSSVNVACIASSDRVISPVPLSDWETDGLEQVAEVVKGINKSLDLDVKLDFLITKFMKDEEHNTYEEVLKIKKISEEIGGELLNAVIPYSRYFPKAQKDIRAIKGNAFKQTLKYTREILEKQLVGK